MPTETRSAAAPGVSVRGLGLPLGAAAFGNPLTREPHGRTAGPAATAAAVPDALSWGVTAALVPVALVALLPRTVGRPEPA
ncbi:hypothetical protein [Actinomadura litoris]|uniref:Uncharacterized protein n=1 Tax=Actinomadura litoris TaxID=2678616 RepID=A0A7K1KY36_9ACTN|nr:hypothetical protein [Actinomadura litoris]MUN36866.1 hypothetical protein [Actinomadura litoris]